jgi:hypothetical protein
MEMTNYIQLVGRMIHECRNCFVQFVLLSIAQDAKKRGVWQIEKYFQSMQTRSHKSHPPSQEFFSMGFWAILTERIRWSQKKGGYSNSNHGLY